MALCAAVEMPNKFRTHEDSLKTICVICWSKGKDLRPISSSVQHHLKLIFSDYEFNDKTYPKVICDSCRKKLTRTASGENVRLDAQDHDRIRPLKYVTRSNDDENMPCDCTFCDISRGNIHTSLKTKEAPGRPREFDDKKLNSDIKICTHCFNEIARGKRHECSMRNKYRNIDALLLNSSSDDPEKYSASVINNKLSFENGHTTLSTIRSGSLNIEVSSSGDTSRTVTAQDLNDIQVDMNLSSRKVLKLAQHLRSKTGRKSVEANMKLKLPEMDHLFDDYFDFHLMDFNLSDARQTRVSRPIIFCKDVEKFIIHVCSVRNMDPHNLFIKIGIDSGGNFLKFCLSLTHENEHVPKYSGVKGIFIIAIVPDVAETYVNLKYIWITSGLQNLRLKYHIAADLKICNLLIGLQSHGCLHPCTWCDMIKTDLQNVGEIRTSNSVKDLYWKYNVSGDEKVKAKKHGNVIHPPIPHFAEDEPIIRCLPPPELHLLIGAVSTLYKHMEEQFTSTAHTWLVDSNVRMNSYHGGTFTGNDARSLLKKVDILASKCPLHCLPFVKVFRSLNKVVKSCFGYELEQNFERHINEFREEYLALSINVTPKIHAIFYHVAHFCNFTKEGLGKYCEQSSESVHYDFKMFWENYKINDINRKEYPERLLRAVLSYNCRHL